MADSQERVWEDLLLFIEERTVIPIIGPELLTIKDGEHRVPLYSWVANRLAAVLEIPTAGLPEGFTLNDVVSLHLRTRRERESLYPRILQIMRSASLTPPEPLRALGCILGFDLFVSVTFDSLLAEAINAARFGGAIRTEQVAYSPNDVRDLANPKKELSHPVVFQLLGRASSSPDYAICDDDLLEFLHAMQDKQRQPKLLFDALRANHLLILGCTFGDWLARFFLRTARNLELSQRRKRQEWLVDSQVTRDANLVLFLESFSLETRVLPLTAVDFVMELERRWRATHTAEPQVAKPADSEEGAGGARVPAGAIFVSYASEDLAAARRLAEGLRAAGLEVWFDKDALKMGDIWALRIRRGIKGCALFLPVISQQTLSGENRRSYFWNEWKYADELAHGMAPDEVFIVPVVIDDTPMDRAAPLDSFANAQSKRIPDGAITPEVTESLKQLVREYHRRQRGN
ncbi:MAG TPA: toll/interleukin-1 receptor domain-containing protein [Candidatus Methylomirabilis sp.]|nr:toll/interleukin-1 receptor domain-containing protein [Candidatus Methylomirabilis sp.]